MKFTMEFSPHKTIYDFSHTLTAQQCDNLTTQIRGLDYDCRVVILPKNISPKSINDFTSKLGLQGNVQGNRMVVVIDIKGHKVRAACGEQVGVSSQTFKDTIVPANFKPYMGQHDLEGAISHTLAAVNETAVAKHTSTQVYTDTTPADRDHTYSSSTSTPPTYVDVHANSMPADIGPAFLTIACWVLGVALVGGVVALFVKRHNEKQRLDKLSKQYTSEEDKLNTAVNEVEQASEYLKPEGNEELTEEVNNFIASLTELRNDKHEADELAKHGKIREAGDAMAKCVRQAQQLLAQGTSETQKHNSLLNRVNAATGYAGKQKAKPQKTSEKEESKEPATATLPPVQTNTSAITYSHQPKHSRRPVHITNITNQVNSGYSGPDDTFLMLNQLQQDQQIAQQNERILQQDTRIDQLTYEQQHSNAGSYSYNNSNGNSDGGPLNWNNNNNNSVRETFTYNDRGSSDKETSSSNDDQRQSSTSNTGGGLLDWDKSNSGGGSFTYDDSGSSDKETKDTGSDWGGSSNNDTQDNDPPDNDPPDNTPADNSSDDW